MLANAIKSVPVDPQEIAGIVSLKYKEQTDNQFFSLYIKKIKDQEPQFQALTFKFWQDRRNQDKIWAKGYGGASVENYLDAHIVSGFIKKIDIDPNSTHTVQITHVTSITTQTKGDPIEFSFT